MRVHGRFVGCGGGAGYGIGVGGGLGAREMAVGWVGSGGMMVDGGVWGDGWLFEAATRESMSVGERQAGQLWEGQVGGGSSIRTRAFYTRIQTRNLARGPSK